MSLKQLEIQGFKSFRDKTKLVFDPGITCIVGPNGCGKSNIADAFRWVFGEQSAKSMRGNKMPDVIFAGTSQSAPLNFAEVTITLNNNGNFATEYEEVSVTRRLHRSGESDYLINRTPVRLRDIQDMFLDSGVGKASFSIFEQGKIDQVINLSPIERRHIFEEAAGILRFLQRKKEALKKLEMADQNASRVKDIHHEVERQIIVLEKQAEEARLYKENKASLEQMEKCTYVLKWNQLRRRSHETTQKTSSQQEQTVHIQKQIDGLQVELQEAKKELATFEQSLLSKREESYKVRSEKEIKTKEKLNQQERFQEAEGKEKRWKQEVLDLQHKQQERQQERQKLQEQQNLLTAQMTQTEAAAQKQSDKVQTLEVDMAVMREQQQRLHHEMLQKLQVENRLDSDMKQTSVRLENTQERLKQLGERKQKVFAHLQDLKAQSVERKQAVGELSTTVDQQKSSFADMETQLQQLSLEIQGIEKTLEALRQQLNESRARFKALQRLRDDMEGFSKGAKRLIQESKTAKSPLSGRVKMLYELLIPSGDNAKELAALLRPYAQTLVVETAQDLDTLLAFAAQHKIHDFSVLCLENLASDPVKAGKLPKGFKSFKATSELMAHFTQGAIVGTDVAEALDLIRQGNALQFVTAEGLQIDMRHVVFSSTQGEQNAFLREAELKELEERVAEGDKAFVEQDAALKKLQETRHQLQQQRAELDKTLRRSEMKLVESNFSLQKISGEIERAQQESQTFEQEIASLQAQSEELAQQVKASLTKHGEAKTHASDAQRLAQTAGMEIEKQVQLLKAERQLQLEKNQAFQKNQDDVRKAAHALHVLDIKDLESQHQEKRLHDEISTSSQMREIVSKQGQACETALLQINETLGHVQKAAQELEQQTQVFRKRIEKIEGQVKDELVRLKKIENEKNQLGIQSAQIETSLSSLETELQERYQLSIEQALKFANDNDLPIEQLEKNVRSLRQKIQEAGDINLTSIEEYEKHKTRYDFLNTQLDDLDLSRQELIQIITQMDDESRKIFKATFETIRANFQKNFKILFEGGEADLEFTETSDVLEAGIEIIAKPPGKQMRSISLLSGGEKCLTAMALLFAIFEVKPAPFCILDEIDAPLDDSNVERFLNVVRQFIDRCQFIIITHNKRTMAIADILFGVSMEERGVSKLLSLEFEKAELLHI